MLWVGDYAGMGVVGNIGKNMNGKNMNRNDGGERGVKYLEKHAKCKYNFIHVFPNISTYPHPNISMFGWGVFW